MFRSVRTAALLLLFFHACPASAEEALNDKALLLKKAEDAIDRLDRKTADFYAARYLGLCAREACPEAALEPFLKKRKLEPRGFLHGSWDPEFVDWFEKSVRERWGVPAERVREKARSFEIAQAAYKDKYLVTVVAYPELEQWYVLKDGLVSRPMLLATAAFSDHPTLFFGKTLKSSVVQSSSTFLDTQKRKMHYLWTPEFFDVDGDGIPEIWVRFNLVWGNGFLQVLEVYKIRENGKIELFHHFQSDLNGYVRLLEKGSVEVLRSSQQPANTYLIETWKLENKEFKKSVKEDASPSEVSLFPPVAARS